MRSGRYLFYGLLLIFYLLHNDEWLREEGRLLFGLPAGLTYHIGYCLISAVLLAVLVIRFWPSERDSRGDVP